MTSNNHPDLTRAALRAVKSRTMIAGLLVRWEQVSGQQPATALGTDVSGLNSLALCRRPAQDNWGADVAAIADACRIDPDRLSSFLRQAAVFDALAEAPGVVDSEVDGRLMAARDRTDEPE